MANETTIWESGTVVIGKHQFKASQSHDLPFQKGEKMTIIAVSRDSNWYKAKREDGLEGMIPANFVTVVKGSKGASVPKGQVNLTIMPWYHGKLTREEAEELLNPKRNGLYLVRASKMFPGDYALCVCYADKIEHYHIRYQNNKYTIDEEEYFESLTKLVEHYSNDADGLVTRLKIPVDKKDGKMEFSVDSEAFKKAGWHIPKKYLSLGSRLGGGEFGEVYQGEYKGRKVAVKSLKDTHKGLQDFLAEASVMTALQHKNLVQLIGVSMNENIVYLITEFLEKGALLDYLRSRGRALIPKEDQIGFSRNICSGMAYLESKDIIHRDLAARNILVAGDKTAKVADFGLAREQNLDSHDKKIPVKWTAPEAIEGNFSTKSDVWSFGILLWEIYSFGRVPYPRVPVDETVSYVKRGGRPECPNACPPEVYDLMKSCWNIKVSVRPSFSLLQKQLSSLPESACK